MVVAQTPQDTVTLDVPVYENAAYGVAIPRAWDDWVFEPATSRRTTTVIFHPRDASLREQLWGALVLTTFDRDVPLGQIADQRIQSSWRATLGPSFTIVSRESVTVVGFPAILLAMRGSVNRAALDVEEYLVARGGDLILLQFRYPRGVPRDSIAVGYRRVFDGLRIRGAPSPSPGPAPPRPAGPAASEAMWRSLPRTPWQIRSYDALIRLDAAPGRLEFSVRLELVNDGPLPQDSVPVWLSPDLALDSARSASGRLLQVNPGPTVRLAVVPSAPPHGTATLTLYYHLAGGDPQRLSLDPAPQEDELLMDDWVPRVQPLLDSTGQAVASLRPRQALHFDLPASHQAVASGRLTSHATALGRRRMTWVAEDPVASVPLFAIGRYRVVTRRAGLLTVKFWLADMRETASEGPMDSLAALVRAGWSFYSRAFGPLPMDEVAIVATSSSGARGGPGALYLGRAAGFFTDSLGTAVPAEGGSLRDIVLRELARTWWGHAVLGAGPGSAWLTEGFSTWAAIAARGALSSDSVRQRLVRDAESLWARNAAAFGDQPLASVSAESDGARAFLRAKGAAALEAVRRAIGAARFREAIRTFAAAHRGAWATVDDFLALLGPDGTQVLRPYLFAR